jgi:hypothetical protein
LDLSSADLFIVQYPPKFLHSQPDASFDRSEGLIEYLGNLAMRVALEIGQGLGLLAGSEAIELPPGGRSIFLRFGS